jgi:hypothetical protein
VHESRFYEIQEIKIKSLIRVFICRLFNEVASQSSQCQMVGEEVSNELTGRRKKAIIRTLRQMTGKRETCIKPLRITPTRAEIRKVHVV